MPASLDDEALDSLAERLAPRLARRLESVAGPADGWLTAKTAAEHLGISLTALHKLTSARMIPFEQDGPGCKLWFRRDELDAWRRGERKRSETVAGASASKMLPNRPSARDSIGPPPNKNPA